ncbi:uncharacterized protein LOC126672598 [Mercurialis annua]|uniref:uncharacterized protein LOC126672598 n=1 Tax=Mercurialis annua TaxID=3986 RepID=UPI0024AD21A7|nr:uncharacterized protein LOC126672598 [Mercurialis annua]
MNQYLIVRPPEMNPDRSWMYTRHDRGFLPPDFFPNLEEFVNFAVQHPECMNGEEIKCPCSRTKCRNTNFRDVEVVKLHVLQSGFVPDYYVWIHHGEVNVPPVVQQPVNEYDYYNEGGGDLNSGQRMVIDAAGPEVFEEETPNEEAQKFFDMMSAAEEEIWPGNSRHSPLSASVEILDIKCRHQGSISLIDDTCRLLQELLPENNKMPKFFANIKKLVKGLGLPVEVIECCLHNCMIYWGEDEDLTHCKVCTFPRWKPVTKSNSAKRRANVPYKKMFYFPLTPRLQRLYASKATAKHMTWHAEHEMEDEKMCHPSDSPAWKRFSELHTDFADETRNIRLGLCTDGFQPFGSFGTQYSSWPVIVTPYNLPPGMCMKDEFMFLTILVPGPGNPKDQMDIFLQPLIAELNQLWESGIRTYDVQKRQNFQMRAALMWTINDFPAYSMLSGWSTSGRLACPHCMENTEAFTLPDSGKQSWFDCHRKFLPTGHHFRRNVTEFRKGKQVKHKFGGVRTGDEVLAEVDGLGFKRAYETDAKATNADLSKGRGWNRKSIFWDLPYWKTNVIRHNLDVMHIEKNVFDNVFNTVLNVPGKTKDTAKSRAELNKICDRPGLAQDQETGRYPKALYALDRDLKKILLEWIQKLKFPDGYVSNLSRCVDLNSLKMMGMKSHDCHVFMQRLLPIALRELLPPEVWEPLTELSIFFRELTATSLKKADLERLDLDIPKILCKLERIFPPSFFNSMEHLPVHLPYEAMMAGPVQYRWMYPFERYLRKLKNKVSNKGRVEGSISSGYLLEETVKFASFYFKDGDPMLPCRMQRNEVCEMDVDDDVDRLSIFKPKGRPIGASRNRYLDDAEYNAARSYILLNCTEIEPFREVFEGELYEINPEITQTEVVVKLESEFAFWFEQYVKDQTVCTNPYILSLAEGPLRSVKTFKGYCVNGFKFNTEEYGEDRVTMNSGVCVKGSLYGPAESDFYGVLTDIIELEYPALPIKRTVLFKCNWFDPTKKVGMLAHPRYNIVDVNHRKRYNKYEPFILAEQSDQVHYLPYPSKRRDKKDWWAVCKIKARSEIDMPATTVPAFQDDSADHLLDVITNEEPTNLVDPNGEADEAALHNPPLVETEDDYPPSLSDDEDIVAADNIEIA